MRGRGGAVEPQADAVRAPASVIPEVAAAGAAAPTTIPPNVLQNGDGQLTLEDLREAAARRFPVPDGAPTAADLGAEAGNGAAGARPVPPRRPTRGGERRRRGPRRGPAPRAGAARPPRGRGAATQGGREPAALPRGR